MKKLALVLILFAVSFTSFADKGDTLVHENKMYLELGEFEKIETPEIVIQPQVVVQSCHSNCSCNNCCNDTGEIVAVIFIFGIITLCIAFIGIAFMDDGLYW